MKKLLLLTLCFSLPFNASAASSDKLQIADMKADNTLLNYKKHFGVYTGHVKLTQGTTVIQADKLTTYFTQKMQLEKAVASGQLASYTTLPDNSKLPFSAAGQTILYYPMQGLVELIGQAKAAQGQDSLAGPHLKYNAQEQTVVSLPTKNGRTTIIIQPAQKFSQ